MIFLNISASDQPSAAARDALSLDHARPGTRVRIVKMLCGSRCAVMLAHRGVRMGEVLSVAHRAPLGGAVWVEAGGAMFAIGRGVARKLFVSELAAGD
jgi:Fe2+ transport system protein FeoA